MPAPGLRWALPLALASTTCGGPRPLPLDGLNQPAGLALSPSGRWLFVTNGNFDQSAEASTLVTLDLEKLEAAISDPGSPGSSLDTASPCRARDDAPIECDPSALIDRTRSIVLGSGAGNIAIDVAAGGQQSLYRLLIPSRVAGELTWIDTDERNGLDLDCGQDASRVCDDAHVLDEIAGDPANIHVDEQGFRFAYLPHIRQSGASNCDDDDPACSSLTLLRLDGERGPEIADTTRDFFREDDLNDTGISGGFAVAQRPCQEGAGIAPDVTNDCTRPLLYASHRFWWGIRSFRVAPGLDLMISGGNTPVVTSNLEAAAARPFVGDLEFTDETGDELLVVQTTPPALARVDTSVEANGEVRNEVIQAVPLCGNPNMLEVYRPTDDTGAPAGEPLALVSCFSDDSVAVVSLSSYQVIATIGVGDGANELAVDVARQWLYVANTREHSLSVIDLDRTDPRYLREVATIGLGKSRDG